MIKKFFPAVLVLILCFPALGYGNKDQLVLDKLRLDIHISMGDSACDELMYIDTGRDVSDMRNFPCYFRTGKYTFTLSGPSGTTVTLFGKNSFSEERGYLIVRKKDDKPVWVLHLEDYPAGEWFISGASRDSGAYEVFYKAEPIFSQNVSSIKWGQWWTGGSPAAGEHNP
jgi:hypothetical protein